MSQTVMEKNDINNTCKKSGWWNRIKLRGRMLIILLSVSLLAVTVCTASFAVMNSRMLDGARNDARNLSYNVHYALELLIYQMDNHEVEVYVKVQSEYINRRIAELRDSGEMLDWDTLSKEAYDVINKPLGNNGVGTMDASEAILFILIDETVYVCGADKETFMDYADRLFRTVNDNGEFENTGFSDAVSKDNYVLLYIQGDESMQFVSYPIDDGNGRLGILILDSGAGFHSDRLRELLDMETQAAVDSMAEAAWRSLAAFAVVITALLIILPLASRKLAVAVVNPVEREQEHQRNLLEITEKEKAMLNRLNHMKTEFMQNTSHDLKTPLTVISTDILNAADQLYFDPDKEDMRESLENAQREIMRMARMIDNTMKHASMNEASFDMKEIKISSLLREGANTYQSILDRRGNKITFEIPESLPSIYGNSDTLLYVLSNLLSNANRYTHNGEIKISASVIDDMVNISVQDNGDGVNPELMPHIFERGVSDGGTGFGLSICKSAVEDHKGTISIESHHGEGTTVTFTLPVYADQDAKG